MKNHRILKLISGLTAVLMLAFSLSGCGTEPSLVRYDISSWVYTLDPQFAERESEQLVIYNMMEGLMRQRPDGTLEEGVIERYEVSQDQKRYTFYLREGMSWED